MYYNINLFMFKNKLNEKFGKLVVCSASSWGRDVLWPKMMMGFKRGPFAKEQHQLCNVAQSNV